MAETRQIWGLFLSQMCEMAETGLNFPSIKEENKTMCIFFDLQRRDYFLPDFPGRSFLQGGGGESSQNINGCWGMARGGPGARSAGGKKGLGAWSDFRNSWSAERQGQIWGLERGAPSSKGSERGAPRSKMVGARSAVCPWPPPHCCDVKI